jgi:hypothetical protein
METYTTKLIWGSYWTEVSIQGNGSMVVTDIQIVYNATVFVTKSITCSNAGNLGIIQTSFFKQIEKTLIDYLPCKK